MADTEGVLELIAPRSAVLFLLAGVLSLLYASLWGLMIVADLDYPILRDVVFRVPGYVLAAVALLGLYPSLAERSPRFARIGGIFVGLSVVGWLVDGLVGSSRSLAVYLGAEPPAWMAAFGLLILLGYVVGYPAFGVASLRTDIYSPMVGLALLGPLAVTILNFGIVFTGNTAPLTRFVVSVGYGLVPLVVGFALRNERFPTGRADARPTEVHHD